MLNLIRDVAVGSLGVVSVLVFFAFGFYVACFSLVALTSERQGWRVPDYCSLFQMFFCSIVVFSLGMKCLDFFFLQNFESGKLILASIANLMYAAVLMLLVVLLLFFEVKWLIEKIIHRSVE